MASGVAYKRAAKYASGTQLGEGSFFGRRAGAHAAAVAQARERPS